MKNLMRWAVTLLVYTICAMLIFSCGPTYRETMTGKEWIKWRQAQDNYDMDKWAREYRRLNNSKAKNKPSVTIEKPNLAVPSPIRP